MIYGYQSWGAQGTDWTVALLQFPVEPMAALVAALVAALKAALAVDPAAAHSQLSHQPWLEGVFQVLDIILKMRCLNK